ncbi:MULTISPECIES: hypothetical protein [unclassified Bradyrhizobium]|nr:MULTISPECIES: hypothetical protein [unclassified Bradyrhizobium]
MATDKLSGIAIAVLLTIAAAMNLVSAIKANQATDKFNSIFCIESIP